MPRGRSRPNGSRSRQGVPTSAMACQYIINFGTMSPEEIELAETRIFSPCRVIVKDFLKHLDVAPDDGVRERFSLRELGGFRIVNDREESNGSPVKSATAERCVGSANSVGDSRSDSVGVSNSPAGNSLQMALRRNSRGQNGEFSPNRSKITGQRERSLSQSSGRAASVSGLTSDSAADPVDAVHNAANANRGRTRSGRKSDSVTQPSSAGSSLRIVQDSAGESTRVIQSGERLSRNMAKRTGHRVNSPNDSGAGPTPSRNKAKRTGQRVNSPHDSVAGPIPSRNMAKRSGHLVNSLNDSGAGPTPSRNKAKRTGQRVNSPHDSVAGPIPSRNMAKRSGHLVNSLNDSISVPKPSRNMAKRTGHRANSPSDSVHVLSTDDSVRVGVASVSQSQQANETPVPLDSASDFVSPALANQRIRPVSQRTIETQTENLEDLMFEALNALKVHHRHQRAELTPEAPPPPTNLSSAPVHDSKGGGASVDSSVQLQSPIPPNCSRTIPMSHAIQWNRESHATLPMRSTSAKSKRKPKLIQSREPEVQLVPPAEGESIGEVLDSLLPDWPMEAPCPKSKKKFTRPKSVAEQRDSPKAVESVQAQPRGGSSKTAQLVESSNSAEDSTPLQPTNDMLSGKNQKRKAREDSPIKIIESPHLPEASAAEIPDSHMPPRKRKRGSSSQSSEIVVQPSSAPVESLAEDENHVQVQPLESVREDMSTVSVPEQTSEEIVIPPPRDSLEDQVSLRYTSSPESTASTNSDHSYALTVNRKEHKVKIFAALTKELTKNETSSAGTIGSKSLRSRGQRVDISSKPKCKKRLKRREKVKEVEEDKDRKEEESSVESLAENREVDVVGSRESPVIEEVVGQVCSESLKGTEISNEIIDSDEEIAVVLGESEELRTTPSPLPTVPADFFTSFAPGLEDSVKSPSVSPLLVEKNHKIICKDVAVRVERLNPEVIRSSCKPRPPAPVDRFDALDFEEVNSVTNPSPNVEAETGSDQPDPQVNQSTGEVFQSTGEVFQSTGEVFQSTGEVFQSTGEVFHGTGESGHENRGDSREGTRETKSVEKTKKSRTKEQKIRKKSGDSKSENHGNRSKSHKSHRENRKPKEQRGLKSSHSSESKAPKSNDSVKPGQKDQDNPSTSTQDVAEKIVKGSDLKTLGTFKIPKKPKALPVIKEQCLPEVPILDRLIPQLPVPRESTESSENREGSGMDRLVGTEPRESVIVGEQEDDTELILRRKRVACIIDDDSDERPESRDHVTIAIEESVESPQIRSDSGPENQRATSSLGSASSLSGSRSADSAIHMQKKRETCARFARSWDSKDTEESDEDTESLDDAESVRGDESPKSTCRLAEVVKHSKDGESSADDSGKDSSHKDDCDVLEIFDGYEYIDLEIGEAAVSESQNADTVSHDSTPTPSPDSTANHSCDSIAANPDSTVSKPHEPIVAVESVKEKSDSVVRITPITSSVASSESRNTSKPAVTCNVAGSLQNPVKVVSKSIVARDAAPISTTDSTRPRQIPQPRPVNNPMRQIPTNPTPANDLTVSRPSFPAQNRKESRSNFPKFLTNVPPPWNASMNSNQSFVPLKKVGICVKELKNPGTCHQANCLQHFDPGTPNLGEMILKEVKFWVESDDVHRFFYAKELILQGAFAMKPERLQVNNVQEYHHELVRIMGQKLLKDNGLEALLQFFEPTPVTLVYQERFFSDILTNLSLRPILAKDFERFALHFCRTALKFCSNALDAVLEMAVSHAPGMLRNCIRKAMGIHPGYLPSPTALNDLLLQALSSTTERVETGRLLGCLPAAALSAVNRVHLRSFCRALEEQGPDLPVDLHEPLQVLRSVAMSQSCDPASTSGPTAKACATVRPQTNRDPRYSTSPARNQVGAGNVNQYQAANYFRAEPSNHSVPDSMAQNLSMNQTAEALFHVPPNRMRPSTGQEFLRFSTIAAPPDRYQEVSSFGRLIQRNDSGRSNSPDPELVPVSAPSQRQPLLSFRQDTPPVPSALRSVLPNASRPGPHKYQFVTSMPVPGTSDQYRQDPLPVPGDNQFSTPPGTYTSTRSNLLMHAPPTVSMSVPAQASTQSKPVYIPTPKSQLPPPPTDFELPDELSDSPLSPESPPSFLPPDSPVANASSSAHSVSGSAPFSEAQLVMTWLTLRLFDHLTQLMKDATPHRLDQIGNSIARYYEMLVDKKSSNITNDFIELVTHIISTNGAHLSEAIQRTLATVASTIFARFADHDLEFIQQANILMRECCNLRQWPPYGLCNPVMMELLQVECWIHGGDYLEAAEVLKDFWDSPAKDRMTDFELKREAETLIRLFQQLIQLAQVGINKQKSLRSWGLLYHTFRARSKIPVELNEVLPDLMNMAHRTGQVETVAGITGIIEQVTRKIAEQHEDIEDGVWV